MNLKQIKQGLKEYVKECYFFQTKDSVIIVLGIIHWIAVVSFVYCMYLYIV
ncbi:hypothetical protein ACIVBQ_000445 [Tenacibaculum discolor]